jgi:hypothetical protein
MQVSAGNVIKKNIFVRSKNCSSQKKNHQLEVNDKKQFKLIKSQHEIIDAIQSLQLRIHNHLTSDKKLFFGKIPNNYFSQRKLIINFYCEILNRCELDLTIAANAIGILDRYLISDNKLMNELKFKEVENKIFPFMISGLSLAVKNFGYFGDQRVSKIMSYIVFFMKEGHISSLKEYEMKILNQINWQINMSTVHDFAQHFLYLVFSFMNRDGHHDHVEGQLKSEMKHYMLFVLNNPIFCFQYSMFDIGLGVVLNTLKADLQNSYGRLTPAEHFGFKFSLEILLKQPINHEIIHKIQAELNQMTSLQVDNL